MSQPCLITYSHLKTVLSTNESALIVAQLFYNLLWYKFTVVYCESMNLIGCITIFYLLIENSGMCDCTRDPFSICLSTQRAPGLNLM